MNQTMNWIDGVRHRLGGRLRLCRRAQSLRTIRTARNPAQPGPRGTSRDPRLNLVDRQNATTTNSCQRNRTLCDLTPGNSMPTLTRRTRVQPPVDPVRVRVAVPGGLPLPGEP